MLVVGLTGGIASGKTTVSDLFASLGAGVVDADLVSRSALEPERPGYQLVVDHLGDDILNDDCSINRQKLRELVFNQPELKQWLESSLHPLIYEDCEQALKNTAQEPYVLFVVPLMFETDFHQLTQRICVIDCPRHIQLERLIARDHISTALAEKMIDQQMDNDSRVARADDIIRNSGEPGALQQQVSALHQKYLNLGAGF